MNAPDAVNLALGVLSARLVEADIIGRALDMAGGDSPQPWVSLFCDQLEGITQAASDLECTVRGVTPHDQGYKHPARPWRTGQSAIGR